MPALAGTRVGMMAAPFLRTVEESPSKQGYHWNSNAETYYFIGEAMGEAMKQLAKSGSGKPSGPAAIMEIRTFRNADGSKSFKGRFQSDNAETKKVTVCRTGGKVIGFDLSHLHPDDQEYATSTTK